MQPISKKIYNYVECPICLKDFSDIRVNKCLVTRCDHIFHESCLTRWLKIKENCPECRAEAYLPPSKDNDLLHRSVTKGAEGIKKMGKYILYGGFYSSFLILVWNFMGTASCYALCPDPTFCRDWSRSPELPIEITSERIAVTCTIGSLAILGAGLHNFRKSFFRQGDRFARKIDYISHFKNIITTDEGSNDSDK